MKKRFCAVCAALFACVLSLSGCNGTEKNYGLPEWTEYRASGSAALEGRYSVMGTEAIAHITDAENFASEATYRRAVALWGNIRTLLDDTNASLSATVPTSYISRFNAAQAGETVEIDQTAYEALSLAQTVYTMTDGHYNPAVYQSVRLFGFGEHLTPLERLPDPTDIEKYKELATHFAELTLSERDGKYYATKPDVTAEGGEETLKIDLGGIGKGWCADKVRSLMAEADFPYGYFSFGSSSMVLNKYLSNQDNAYTLSSRDPRNVSGVYCSVKVKDACVSTSADYEQYYTLDGVRYCHIIDPATGAPIAKGIASATVIGGTAAENDALTTALCTMEKEEAVTFINEKLSERTVILLLFEEGQGKVITNAPDRVEIKNGAYTLANSVRDGKIILN